MATLVETRLVLAVRDLRATTAFFVEVLGFHCDFEPAGWSFLSRDHVKVMLGECPDDRPAAELGNHSYVAYLVVEGVDRLHEEVAKRGADVIVEPRTEPWGMREFGIRTPDGHRIRFGEPVLSQPAP